MSFTDAEARLDEFDKVEWRDVARRVRPDMTDEQYEAAWADFVKLKADHQHKLELN